MDNITGIQQKITRTLFFSQSLISAALITTGTVNSIAGAELSGVTAWAGIPATVFLVSAALGAMNWGFLMERIGRRWGLVLGLIVGAAGGLMAVIAHWKFSFPIFLVGMALMGLGQSAMMLGRFAAAEVHLPEERGRAIANVVLGGTVGAIAGPLLVAPAGILAAGFGFNELAGPYGSALILFLIGALVTFIWLRPEPMEIAKNIHHQEPESSLKDQEDVSIAAILRRPGVIVAVATMVIGQAVMVMIMVITSLHMKDLTHPLTSISLVISAHTFGMYAFSVISGKMVDGLGREQVIMLGSGILILAGLSAGLSPQVLPIAVSLFLLGLGWNFCFVGGSTLLTDQLSRKEQSRMQGVNDLLVGFASALGSLGSGFVFAGLGFQMMGLFGAAISLIPLGLTGRWIMAKNRVFST